jgi:hypothetical protein
MALTLTESICQYILSLVTELEGIRIEKGCISYSMTSARPATEHLPHQE